MEQMQIFTDLHKIYPPLTCRLDKLNANNILEKHIEENHCKVVDRVHTNKLKNLQERFNVPIPTIECMISNFAKQAAKEQTEFLDNWLIDNLKAYGVDKSEIINRVELILQYPQCEYDVYRVLIDGQYAFSFKCWTEYASDYKKPYTYNMTFHIKII